MFVVGFDLSGVCMSVQGGGCYVISSAAKRRTKRETRNTADSVKLSQFLLSFF